MAIKVTEYQRADRSELIPLLLIGDADEKQVNAYVNSGRIFVATDDNDIVGVVLVIAVDSSTLEIKNIAVALDAQGRGIGTELLEFVCSYFAEGYSRAIVGTGDADVQNILFYLKRGFRFYAIKKGFFDAYSQQLVDNGVVLKDMVMLEKNLR
ncbi:GNAT family N-acetyltransferase [Lacticaseibacillus zhaodongensis]|uniref:GNAT family N-acetyltransferase n=1 Tax=Lacticaseibacillus zhaodongensis TaxID=2668065 RepID=UPI0012D3381A|nr:GNAT family N-acetyltransferase [Lacticaseibacillus zhaodongensis]